MFWGLTYIFNEHVYEKISVATSLMIVSLATFIVGLAVSYFSDSFRADMAAIASSKRLVLYLLLSIVGVILAEFLIGSSIKASNNATLSGLIEISYPIFAALFSAIIFAKSELSLASGLGGALVFIGIFVIYYFNR